MPKMEVTGLRAGPGTREFTFRVRQVRTEVFEVDLVVRVPRGGDGVKAAEAAYAGARDLAARAGRDASRWRKLDDCTVVDWDPVTMVELVGEDEAGEDVEL